MTAGLACSALGHAIALRNPVGTIVHSDRVNRFRSHVFVDALFKKWVTRFHAAGQRVPAPKKSDVETQERDVGWRWGVGI
ncbi:putative transposase [Rhodococcus opacus B4]|uniref:Putative transposase n=1 Tax=Rhodococcus opacus (strain B4) TaxID=632772 RepID=C1B668_RHOOB|nr:putative transposase [Rhodococcus opacus B4]